MNVLCISRDSSIGDLAYRLKKEGHNVKLFIEDKEQKQNLAGIVEKTDDWRKEISWVGKEGLIIFETFGYGKVQDKLRQEGYSVVGSSSGGDLLETDRQHAQSVLADCGVKVIPSKSFCLAEEATKFMKDNEGPWVLKQNGRVSKSFNYVGELKSGEDTIEVLKNYVLNNKKECRHIDLQKKVEGVEIGVARYFNGSDWVGPIEMNVEHKGLFNENVGPKTDEMGTLAWYDDDENNSLFKKTLARLKPHLQKIDFRGDIDINCIVDERNAYPLEITPRFGFPAIHLHSALHFSPWGELLKAIADGKHYDLKYKKEFGVVVLLATPPYPYKSSSHRYDFRGINILFKEQISKDEWDNIHFEEVSMLESGAEPVYYISARSGYVLHVSGTGDTVEEARKKAYRLIDKIIIPKVFYRTDIGLEFVEGDEKKLIKWGWINEKKKIKFPKIPNLLNILKY